MNNGVFTTIKIINSTPLFFEQHKKRLFANAKVLHIEKVSLTKNDIKKYLEKNNLTDCALKIIVAKENNKTVVTMHHRPLPVSNKNIKLVTVADTRDKNKILKTTDRMINDNAKIFADNNNAQDATFVKNKKLIESTISNIFSVNKNGDIITPPLTDKGLKGIAREIIMKNIKVLEEEIPEDTTQPIVLTNCLRVQMATHLNGKKLQNGEKLFQKIKMTLEKMETIYLSFPRTWESRKRLDPRLHGDDKKKIYYKELSWINPEEAFVKLFANAKHSFWLDSSLTNESSHFSYMGVPSKTITYDVNKNTTFVQINKTIKKVKQNIFDYLDNQLKENIIETKNLPFPFIGGYVGYFGYELKKLTGAKSAFKSDYPDSLWYFTEKTIVFDHKEKKMYLVCLTGNKIKADKWFKEIVQQLTPVILRQQSKNLVRSEIFRSAQDDIQFKLDRDKAQYLKDIKACQEYLAKGDSYQICLTNNIRATGKFDPLQLYLSLRQSNPAPYSAFIRYNDLAILSSSPEQFLKIEDGQVTTKPIKGTIRRGEYLEEDNILMQQLSTSKKDWSENAMIVDLLRNDLGKVSEFASIKTDKLMTIESYQTVHQLVSTVSGTLRKDVSMIDCIKAAFPGGSMTGAPKIRTMEIIDSLEKKARGIYSGALGFLSLNQTASLNIVIRTIVIKKNELAIGAGGAILIDSDPEKEYEEMMLKANLLLQTVASMYNPAMHTVFLALGSNVGNKKETMENAIKLLGEKIKNISVAKYYETQPMYFENQDTFLNSALYGETNLSPQELLTFVKQIEKELGRKKRFRNGPREIDIDILFYDDLIFKSETLQIPHSLIQEREFVLKPLMDIAPDFVHPILKKNIKQLFSEENAGVARLEGSQHAQ